MYLYIVLTKHCYDLSNLAESAAKYFTFIFMDLFDKDYYHKYRLP